MKNIPLNVGTVDVSLDNVFNGQLARRLFFAMVNNSAFNGARDRNPYKFENFNLVYFACYIDGYQFLINGFQPDFSN